MKLISVAIFSFAFALLALAFGLRAPAFLNPEREPPSAPAVLAPDPPPGPQILDEAERSALDAARRDLATALQVRTEAEATRDAARAHMAATRGAFEALMIDLTEVEINLEEARERRRRRTAEALEKCLRTARQAVVAAEARLSEAVYVLEQAEATYDQAEASMARARESLRAVTASSGTHARV